MSKIFAFAGSNSSKSINYELVKYTASLLKEQTVDVMEMSNFNMPMYSEDLEKAEGFSNSLNELRNSILQADAVIISVNEHNSALSAFFKNVIDWLSRLERKFLEGKKILLMATSPGKRGGIGALEMAEAILPRFGAEIVVKFSLPSYGENFKKNVGIIEPTLKKTHEEAVIQFLNKI